MKMKISNIKKINEWLPDWTKIPFSKIIRKRLIHNRKFLTQYRELCESKQMSEEQRESLTLAKLKSCIQHAYEHTEYYREIFDQRHIKPDYLSSLLDLGKLPILTKEKIAENYNKLSADDIDNFYEVSTGGTSGKPIHIRMERDAIYKEWAFVYYYWSKFGYDYKKSRLATFRGVNLGNKISSVNPLYQEIRFNPFLMGEGNIEQYIEKMDRYGVDFIYGYPSIIYNFCRICQKKSITVRGRFQAALLISENLYDFQKDMIENVLNCPIAIFYGNSERGVFAECENDEYSFNQFYGITEVTTDGKIIVTGFINNKMPLIRYLVDDYAHPVGHNKYHIVGHHDHEVLLGKGGVQISSASINFHDNTFNGISNYQFVQDQVGECVLHIVPESGFDMKNLDRIQTNIKNKFGSSITCRIKIASTVQLTSRGKYKMIIQNVKKSD